MILLLPCIAVSGYEHFKSNIRSIYVCLTFKLFWETSGERLDGFNSEAAAQKLRGRAGTAVTVKLQSVIFIFFL